MGKYLINGSKYEISEDIQGEELTRTLEQLAGTPASPSPTPAVPKASADPRKDKILAYLSETDTMLKMAPGTSAAQINQESRFNDKAVSPRGAKGLAQVMDTTRAVLEKRVGRPLDPHNTDDALLMHREVMKENVNKFGPSDDSLRAYNAGWDKSRWNNKETNGYTEIIAKGRTQFAPTPDGAPRPAYAPFATVRKDIDPKSLNKDPDWLLASSKMYLMQERKEWEGDEAGLAEWGKTFMGDFNFNMLSMTRKAHSVNTQGSQEDKEAFLFMMDSYDNTNFSGEGAWRAAKALSWDPTTYVGAGTLGIGTAGKVLGSSAAKQGIKQLLKQGLGRTGVIAGVEGGIYGATDSALKQSVEVSAGRKQSTDLGQLALSTGIGVAGGAVLGTAADAALTGITSTLRRRFSAPPAPAVPAQPTGRVEPSLTPPGDPAVPSVVPDIPLKGILTDAEIAAATSRKQTGRLPEDAVAPPISDTAAKLSVPEANTGLRSTPMSMDELTTVGGDIAGQLKALSTPDLHEALEPIRRMSLPFEEMRIVARGVQLHADELRIRQAEIIKLQQLNPTSANYADLVTELAEVETRLGPLSLADDAFGSMAGSILRQRQEGLPGMQGVTIESLMTEKGLSRTDAEGVFAKLVEGARESAEAQKVSSVYEPQIQAALDSGDLKTAAQLTIMKNRELDSLVDTTVGGSQSWIAKVNEFAISNVFSPTTIAINLVPSMMKTLALPLVRSIVTDPLQAATRAQLAASYTAMRSTFGAAWRGAKASYRYEQSLLTRDSGKLLEGELAIQGKKGGVIRFIPRILNATDEFLAQINYNSFIAGTTAAKATEEGTASGLKGAALTQFVEAQVKESLGKAYKQGTGEELIQPIINKGVSLGLSGDDLLKYVEREAVKDPEALRHGQDEQALDFVRDVLYKRRFSGDGMASTGALLYEQAMSKIPAAKLVIGQLFFRTPIRVFEEGVRMTPGLQILAPNYLADLAGKNGGSRQVRAQGEALASLAIAGAVFTLYGEGKVAGDGAYKDWKQSRLREDSALPGQYTLKMDDGSTWSFRGFDPIATPVKMMVNALERLDKLAIREAQGEMIDKGMFQKSVSAITVATMAIASALRDANLLSGLDGTIKVAEAAADPEGKETAWLKYMGEKIKLLAPNTLHKIAKENDPTIKDPATFWQVVESRFFGIGGEDIKTSNSYDILGSPRQPADTGTLWNIFSTATVEERNRNKSPEAQFVMKEMDRLARETGAVFAPPLKHEMTGSFDLRTVLTSDKQETLYDRWQRNFKDLQPENFLYPIVAAEMPDGTFKHKGMRVEVVQKVLGDLRQAAFMKLLSEEQKVLDELIKKRIYEATTSAGVNDYANTLK